MFLINHVCVSVEEKKEKFMCASLITFMKE